MKNNIIVVGAGLAGSECAWQLASKGFQVTLYEMKPNKKSPAHKTDKLAELVCSNSFRGNNKESSAVGILHYELEKLGSLVLESAYKNRVPAGDALAVDRELFSEYITEKIYSNPNITVVHEEFTNILEASKDNIVVIATGPLTSDNLSEEISSLIGEDNALKFFDAIAPIVYKDSIDFNHAWFQSRYDKSETKDYINCELTEEVYKEFYNELINAEYSEFTEWETNTPYFEGCLPIEVMAKRGEKTLLFGPMKPVGLTNPNTNETPFAVIQLRQDNLQGTLYNIVGFQTKMKYFEQKRIFKIIPALANAEFAKLGTIHRNTFINSPKLLNSNLSLKSNPNVFFAGQITGCEGYVESTAIGFAAAINIINLLNNENIHIPEETAIGSIVNHVTVGSITEDYQPMNINFGLFPKLESTKKLKKSEKKRQISERAIKSVDSLIKHYKI